MSRGVNLSETHLELTEDEVVLCAEIRSEGSTFDARIGVNRDYVGLVDPSSNPFVPAATIGAAVLGQDLDLEAAISPQVRDGAHKASGLYREWWGHRPPVVSGPTVEPRFPSGQGRGLFFTRGVDSMFSFVQSVSGAIEPFTHFIGVADVDHWVSSTARASTWDETETFADDVGVPIVRVTSNLREFLDPLAAWDYTHGAFLACVALAVSPLFRSVVVSSTQKEDDEIPYGSHSMLDPLWSTERTSIEHIGSSFGRAEKAMHLAEHPEMLAHLKVCWVGDTPRNCGKCEKCLRTMTALVIAGGTPGISFEADLSPETVEAADLRSERIAREVLRELVPVIPDHLSRLRAAWARVATDFLAVRALTPEERAAPVHLSPDAAHAVLATFPASGDRAAPWCLVDDQSAGAVALADGLTEIWGPGLCYLSGVPWGDGQPPGIPSVERILRASRVRVWWSERAELDVERLAESVRYGCAPVQMMPTDAADGLRRRLPRRLHDCVVGWDVASSPAMPHDPETNRMIGRAVAELVAGSLNSESTAAGA